MRCAGSSPVFECLLRAMVSKGLLAAVRFSRLAASPAKIAVLVPQEEMLDEDGAQAVPPGAKDGLARAIVSFITMHIVVRCAMG